MQQKQSDRKTILIQDKKRKINNIKAILRRPSPDRIKPDWLVFDSI